MQGKIPPHNIEAEQSLLGALLIDKDAIGRIADAITPLDFYKTSHTMIFEAMLDLFEKRDPIDLLSLGNRLDEKKNLEAVGGRSYLIGLAQIVPTSSNVVHYASIIHKKATLRRLQAAASEITELSYTDEDIEQVLDKAEERVFAVAQKLNKQVFTPLKTILGEAFERIDEIHKEKGKLRGIPTGFSSLDNLLAGLQKSDLIVIAARPSVGKTSFALDIARKMSIQRKASVGIFSLEMSKEQLVDRLICSEAGVDLWKMRTGRLSDRGESDDFVRIGHAMNTLSEARMYIDDSASANILEIKAKARRLQSEHGLDCIILDYLQLMEGKSKPEGRVQEVAEITRGLKSIARELGIPVVALSQLSRAVELNKPALPRLAHLRESGSIEQDSDVVIFIYRKSSDRNYRYDELTEEEKHTAEIIVAKHRNGPTGSVKLFWDEKRVSFRSLDQQTQQEEPLFQLPF
ncbi:replicative DNA helicase [Candidatus Uhrbacteria bacterium]|nr:replicative DNA helicase [Candidatus Uhrbacteria bacterium]